jgi:hypothetical protein
MPKTYRLTEDQRAGIVERCELHVEDTSYDWQCVTDDEHNKAVSYWSDIMRELGYAERADKLDSNYKLTS